MIDVDEGVLKDMQVENEQLRAENARAREIFRKALASENEPGFVGLWVEQNQENDRLRTENKQLRAEVEKVRGWLAKTGHRID